MRIWNICIVDAQYKFYIYYYYFIIIIIITWKTQRLQQKPTTFQEYFGSLVTEHLDLILGFYISLQDIYTENIRHNYLIIQGIRILLINCHKPMGVSIGRVYFFYFNHAHL